MEKRMQERRRFVRIPESLPISYKIIHDAKAGTLTTQDISQDGIRFFIRDFVPRDTLLKIRLDLQKVSFSFETFVRIVWIKEEASHKRYEVGAEFISIPEKATEHLIDYIKTIVKSK